jgi:hypothetical protein
MAGTGVALVDPFSVIRINPASYASMARPAFEVGIASQFIDYRSANNSTRGQRMDILGFTIGVPFGKNNWGIAMGLNPESSVAYSISDTRAMPSGLGNVEYLYSGSGGLNRAFIGLGHAPWQRRDSLGNGSKLSLGANLNYLFGNIENTRKAFYPGNLGYYNTAVVSSTVMRNVGANAGVQFQGDLIKRRTAQDEGLRYIVGFAAELPSDMRLSLNGTVYSFGSGVSGLEFPLDTIGSVTEATGTAGLPVQLSMGFTVYNSRWAMTVEHRRRDWGGLTVDLEGVDVVSQVGDAASYMFGATFRPAGQERGTFWQSTIYRAGFRFTDDYLVVAGEQLQEIGMSFGLSMPVMGSTTRSRLTLGAELGERGKAAEGLIQERYATVFIGISITPDIREQWFKKRRIE